MNKTRLSHVIFLVVCALWVQSSFAQDYTPWSLSAEALARSGKASVGAGDQTAASRAGVWLDDTNTSAEIALFTGHTDFVWSVAFAPDGKTLASARLKIYNTLGQPVRTLVDQYQSAGSYQVAWDGRDQRGAAVAAGVYLIQLFYPGGEQTRRMLLLK